jgi:hypothetical protein
MQRVVAMTDEQRSRMARAAKRHRRLGIGAVCRRTMKAVEAARSRPPPNVSLFDRALLWALAHRP